ncbi:hypothetical protein DM02DRAFT_624462 [Periconia macrospinosa]|uniref:Uncharacterized protein n=1 Tax=Periconia macrospinosa TaxID=97972 RepID=A0A2V1E3M8_9PLEO|nr:hypothetical protein DM02DRAFT_624462 [Periconia macrospinosa]
MTSAFAEPWNLRRPWLFPAFPLLGVAWARRDPSVLVMFSSNAAGSCHGQCMPRSTHDGPAGNDDGHDADGDGDDDDGRAHLVLQTWCLSGEVPRVRMCHQNVTNTPRQGGHVMQGVMPIHSHKADLNRR